MHASCILPSGVSSPQTEIAEAALPIVHLILLLCKRIQCKTSGQPPGPPTVLIAPHRTAAAVFVSPVHGTHQLVHQAPTGINDEVCACKPDSPRALAAASHRELLCCGSAQSPSPPEATQLVALRMRTGGWQPYMIGVVISEPNDANGFSAMLIGQRVMNRYGVQ